MKHNFRGWNSVFAFTFRQSAKGVSFKLITALITLIIIGAFILINILVAKPEDPKDNQPSPIKKVFILDNSGLQPADYKAINPVLTEENFAHIEFVTVAEQSREDVIKTAAADSPEAIAAIITAKDAGYQLEFVIPADATISKDDVNKLVEPITSGFETSKLLQVGLTVEQLTTVMMPVVPSFSDIGESTSEIAFVIKMVAPMLFGLMLYMMLLLYGQTISKSVSTEKTSRLMETLLTSIHPYALITGKVLAVTSMALIQFVSWIVAAVIGLYGGNAIAHAIYPDYQNSVITIINFLKDNIGETAMTLPAVILAILFFCVGFLFYCVIAGLAGCMVAKPEDVASTQAIFQFPVIISWLVCYIAPIMQNDGIIAVARYIPFTAPFCVPVDLITGTIGLVQGLIALAILVVFTFFVIMLSGRLYKGLILYSGQKVSFQMIGNVLKNKK